MFVLKKRYDKKGKEINVKIENDCISPTWSLLLSKFSDDKLKEIIYSAPKLQPALPIAFCKKNLGVLSDDYGMPNVDICKLYCLYKITSAKNISDYNELKHKLYVYSHCNATHLKGEGVPMCQMGTRRIKHLEKRLEVQYENTIKKNAFSQLNVFIDDTNIVNKILTSTSEEFNKIGLFIEKCNILKDNFFEFDFCEKIIKMYENLSRLMKDAFKSSFINCVNKSVLFAAKSEDLTPWELTYKVEKFGNLILESTKQELKELVNERFSNLNDSHDLLDAYSADFITGIQYYYRYKQITCDFSVGQFLKELSSFNFENSPMVIQWYVVSNIIKQLGFESLDSRYIDIDSGSIYDIKSLLEWFEEHGHLKDVVLKKAEEKICSVLSNKEKWILFENQIIRSPGIENIRKHLDNAYKKKLRNNELFKYSCFQDVMLSDASSNKDLETKIFIVDNLDANHQCLMQQKAKGLLKLYSWQKHPSTSFDWNLIKSHFHELSAEAQINILLIIFGKIASGDLSLSVDDLYSEFVKTTTPASPIICGILFILKEKKNDMNVSITTSMIESVIGEEKGQRISFLEDCRKLFYPCYGYGAISHEKQDIDGQIFNGFVTKEIKNNELYYVVHFYDLPIDLFGEVSYWLSDFDFTGVAEQVLIRNTNVEVINDKYYIHESQEFFLKQFVIAYDIDDKCGLVSDEESMIEREFFPINNVYQPLYTNYLSIIKKSDNYICRCGSFGGSFSRSNIPFFWCNKEKCVRRGHFLLPPSQFKYYRFADLLFITLGQSPDCRESVWQVNSEISQFICDYIHVVNSNNRDVYSKSLNELEEIGFLDEMSSSNNYDDEYDEYEEDYEDDSFASSDSDETTYDKYNGSYAQDEMGYSDNDIDTIFDGEPDAYWNID